MTGFLSMIKLLIYSCGLEKELKETIELPENEAVATFTFGRNPKCDYCFKWSKSPFLSGWQFTLIKYAKEQEYYLIDGLPEKPSRNGVWLNKSRVVEKTELKHGDRLLLAGGMIEVEYYSQKESSRLADDLEETLTFDREDTLSTGACLPSATLHPQHRAI